MVIPRRRSYKPRRHCASDVSERHLALDPCFHHLQECVQQYPLTRRPAARRMVRVPTRVDKTARLPRTVAVHAPPGPGASSALRVLRGWPMSQDGVDLQDRGRAHEALAQTWGAQRGSHRLKCELLGEVGFLIALDRCSLAALPSMVICSGAPWRRIAFFSNRRAASSSRCSVSRTSMV